MELIQVADAVAREKNINRDEVLEAMEDAISKAGRSKYGYDQDIRAHINRDNGEIKLQRFREVVENGAEIENDAAQLQLDDAKDLKKDAEIGDFIINDLPPIDFGRIAAQTAKQVILQKVREAERSKQFDEFKDRVGEVVTGIVKRADYGNVTVDLGRAEAIIRRDEGIPRENLKQGERVKAFIYDVRRENRGPQIFLSRSRPEFMAELFAQEVPEIYEGTIQIKGVARDPGSRAKITVLSSDGSMDPVGACVGMRGSRVQAVVNELQGEKIDIIPFTEDLPSMAVSCLSPAQIAKVVVDEEKNRIDVVVPEEQLSLAIGRRGQNVRLASKLLGWDIDILTEAEESERRANEYKERTELFMQALDVDDMIANLLVAEGFTSIQELAEIELDELASIEGFDEDVAAELQNRALLWLEQIAENLKAKQKELGLKDDLVTFEHLDPQTIITLGEKGLKTLDDLADLAGDELIEMLEGTEMSEDRANEIIMAARAHWFEGEENESEASEADAETETAEADVAGEETEATEAQAKAS